MGTKSTTGFFLIGGIAVITLLLLANRPHDWSSIPDWAQIDAKQQGLTAERAYAIFNHARPLTQSERDFQFFLQERIPNFTAPNL